MAQGSSPGDNAETILRDITETLRKACRRKCGPGEISTHASSAPLLGFEPRTLFARVGHTGQCATGATFYFVTNTANLASMCRSHILVAFCVLDCYDLSCCHKP